MSILWILQVWHAVWMLSCCGMYFLLSEDKHPFVRDNSKSALEIRDNV